MYICIIFLTLNKNSLKDSVSKGYSLTEFSIKSNSWSKDSFKERDYDVWAIAFKNKDGEEIARIDASEDEINNLFNDDPKDDFIRLWRNFDTLEVPNSWLVWPHSKSKDWLEIIEGNIPTVWKKY